MTNVLRSYSNVFRCQFLDFELNSNNTRKNDLGLLVPSTSKIVISSFILGLPLDSYTDILRDSQPTSSDILTETYSYVSYISYVFNTILNKCTKLLYTIFFYRCIIFMKLLYSCIFTSCLFIYMFMYVLYCTYR